jgi:hypothetical protein
MKGSTMTTLAKRAEQPSPATVEDVLIRGDLSQLTEAQRNEYYMRVCQSLGLNYLTQPFAYLNLSGKLVLYAKRDCADQLRKINGISIEIVGQTIDGGLITVHAKARDKSGRTDEDYGVVPYKAAGNEFSANATMKAVTKAKRRVTLSISGLGFLDETEIPEPVQHQASKYSDNYEANTKADLNRSPIEITRINEAQRARLLQIADELDADLPQYLEYLSVRWEFDVLKLADIPADHFDDALATLERKRAKHDPDTGEVEDATP